MDHAKKAEAVGHENRAHLGGHRKGGALDLSDVRASVDPTGRESLAIAVPELQDETMVLELGGAR